MTTESVLNIFNEKANAWLEDLEKVDPEKMNVRPAEKSWSFGEVYDHVMKVTRTFQIPYLKQSTTDAAVKVQGKNKYGVKAFDEGDRRHVSMRMEEFPKELITLFTPVKRDKEDLLKDFKGFIKEVNDLKEILSKSTDEHKQFHPMFGDINTNEWFRLIEMHMHQHTNQMVKLKKFLETGEFSSESK